MPSKVRITGELIENFYRVGKVKVLAVTPVVVLPLSFIILLIVNGIYTLVGLLLNEIRSNKLSPSGIFNLACFSTGTSLAVTGAFIIGLLFSRPLPEVLIPISLLLSLLYMIAAVIFVVKQDPQPS